MTPGQRMECIATQAARSRVLRQFPDKEEVLQRARIVVYATLQRTPDASDAYLRAAATRSVLVQMALEVSPIRRDPHDWRVARGCTPLPLHGNAPADNNPERDVGTAEARHKLAGRIAELLAGNHEREITLEMLASGDLLPEVAERIGVPYPAARAARERARRALRQAPGLRELLRQAAGGE